MDISNPDALGTGFVAIFMIIYLLLAGFGVYCFILFIKLARRGISALDIYIANNKRE